MPPSKVIRIDEQVWAELQKLARPLEDTPNSVLRRVFRLPEESPEDDGADPRVAKLLGLLEDRLGATPQVNQVKKNLSILSSTQETVAYIRPQHDKLRIGVARESAEKAGLKGWDRERRDGFFNGPSVRWYLPDDDEDAYTQAAELLEKLWRTES